MSLTKVQLADLVSRMFDAEKEANKQKATVVEHRAVQQARRAVHEAIAEAKAEAILEREEQAQE